MCWVLTKATLHILAHSILTITPHEETLLFHFVEEEKSLRAHSWFWPCSSLRWRWVLEACGGNLGFFHGVRWGRYRWKTLTAPPLALSDAPGFKCWLSVSGLFCRLFSLPDILFLPSHLVTLTPLSAAPAAGSGSAPCVLTTFTAPLYFTFQTRDFWRGMALGTMPGPL